MKLRKYVEKIDLNRVRQFSQQQKCCLKKQCANDNGDAEKQ